jgi:hypothetical protein
MLNAVVAAEDLELEVYAREGSRVQAKIEAHRPRARSKITGS